MREDRANEQGHLSAVIDCGLADVDNDNPSVSESSVTSNFSKKISGKALFKIEAA
jgi:hypothetical protein